MNNGTRRDRHPFLLNIGDEILIYHPYDDDDIKRSHASDTINVKRYDKSSISIKYNVYVMYTHTHTQKK
jgi:hypothetical protein